MQQLRPPLGGGNETPPYDIHHRPWPLQPATVVVHESTVASAMGIELPHEPPLLHYSERQDIVIWPLRSPGGRAG